MSNVLEKLTESPRETVEEMQASTGAVMEVGLQQAPSRRTGATNGKSKLAHNSTASVQSSYLNASTTLDGMHVIHHTEEQEYCCKYCPKKFSNKQALGGHQNAHTIERVIERSATEGLKAKFGYASATSNPGMTCLPFNGSFYGGLEIFNQLMTNRSYDPQTIHNGELANGNLHSTLPIPLEHCFPEPFQGITHFCPIWRHPHLTNSQFAGHTPGMEDHRTNLWDSTLGTTSSSAGTTLGMYQGLSAASSLRSLHNTDVKAETNSQITHMINQQCQDSELDLSLKL